jgi:hypothetical protein
MKMEAKQQQGVAKQIPRILKNHQQLMQQGMVRVA